jgi:DNA-binding response OmpR family regulator
VPKILVIDDDPIGTELLITLLELGGYQGSGVEDWTDPVGEVAKHHPDLVIMDVRLSGVDGFAVLKQLQAHSDPAVARIPVLMMSAEDHRVQSRSAGASRFVEKPFDWQNLLRTIDEIVEDGTLGK